MLGRHSGLWEKGADFLYNGTSLSIFMAESDICVSPPSLTTVFGQLAAFQLSIFFSLRSGGCCLLFSRSKTLSSVTVPLIVSS